MVGYHLPRHIHYCEIGSQRVFLDLQADRYFSLPDAADAAFGTLTEPRLREPTDGLTALAAAGLLVRPPEGRPPAPTVHPRPVASLLEESSGSGGSNSAIPEVALLVLRARSGVRRRQLPRLLSERVRARAAAGGGSVGRDEAVHAFLRARRLIPVAPNCLYDSLALRRYLQRRSIAVDLVIGAKLHPFGAHCWLQDGSLVLNDSLASARDFAPILVA
jgi:hypothetical protein